MTAELKQSACDPVSDCAFCPRLVDVAQSIRAVEPGWHNAPVPTFAAADVRVLIVGLAPGLRGANRTGRPFTGDFAGDLLYATLLEFGFAEGEYRACAEDNLRLKGCAITNAVRCVPPQNKPTPREINACRPFLAATIEAAPDLCAIVALGRIAHEFGRPRSRMETCRISLRAWRRTCFAAHKRDDSPCFSTAIIAPATTPTLAF